MAELCAVVGVGQTKHAACRADVSIAGLVREAVDRALADANITIDDVDAIVIGKAPDSLEGVAMPELWLTDALAAHGKPVFRGHTAGSVGGSTAIVAAQHVMESWCSAMYLQGINPFFDKSGVDLVEGCH